MRQRRSQKLLALALEFPQPPEHGPNPFRLLRERRDGPVRNVLKNSFGMGGLAASMVLQNPRLVH